MEIVKPNPPNLSVPLLRAPANAGLAPGKPGVFLHLECPLRLFDVRAVEAGDTVLASADENSEDRVVMVYRRAA